MSGSLLTLPCQWFPPHVLDALGRAVEAFSDRLIDIHCDEIDDEQSRFLEVVSALTDRRHLGSRVTASHTTADRKSVV